MVRPTRAILVDNGPDYLPQVFWDWCRDNDVALHYIQPGKSNQNAYIERFNLNCQQEVIDGEAYGMSMSWKRRRFTVEFKKRVVLADA